MEKLKFNDFNSNIHLPELLSWKKRFGDSQGYKNIEKYIFAENNSSSFKEIGFNSILNPKTGSQRHSIVATNNQEIVGVVSFDLMQENSNKPCSYIKYVFINPAYQNKGLGKEILYNSIKAETKNNPNLKTFLANIRLSNKTSQKLFASLGFKPTNEKNSSKLVQLSATLKQIEESFESSKQLS